MKRVILVCMTLLLAAVLTVPVLAERTELVDHAALLTPSQSAAVESALEQAGHTLDMDVVIVTVNSLNGSSARRYAEDFYDNNGYADTGVLLLVCMAEREYWVTTTGDISLELEALEEEFVPFLSSQDFEEAFLSFAQNLPFYLTEGTGGEDEIPVVAVLFGCVVVGLVVALIATLVMKSQLRSVRPQRSANSYLIAGSFRLNHSRDIFLYRNVTRTPKPKSGSSSSSGRSHGGGGGRF